MKYLGWEAAELTRLGAIHTAREISQQPELWRKILAQVEGEQNELEKFFYHLKDIGRIILTGAGTSAFIGMSLRGTYQRKFNILTEAVPTTDLISHPNDYLHPDIPTLLISFARSGNSPESVGALILADQICGSCSHLIITCNGDGLLANYKSKNRIYLFTLPPEANDQSLAMTSSYSGMLLAARLLADMDHLQQNRAEVASICGYAEKILNDHAPQLRQIAAIDFQRAVFLGSGPFFGTATEGHLKLQELTDGKVICKNDSFLGFRHGPKAVIDSSTLLFYVFSNDPHSLRYEKDLVVSMKKGNLPLVEIGISETPVSSIKVDHSFSFSNNGSCVNEDFLTVCSVLPAQILAFYKSLQLGLKPDSPSSTGAITRVVEGVQIYNME